MGRDKVQGIDFGMIIFALLYAVKVVVNKKVANNYFKLIGEICTREKIAFLQSI